MIVWHHMRMGVMALALTACGTVAEEGSVFSQSLARFQTPDVEPRFAAIQETGAPRLQIALVADERAGDLLLERRNGAFEYWLSSDGVQLVLQHGVIHSTRGLGEGLMASELSEPLARIRNLEDGPSDRFHTYLNGNDEAVTRTYRCDIRRTRDIAITISGQQIQTVLLRESCNSLDQEFENLYWVNPDTRQIVQSRQWAGPFVEAISTRIVLP